MIETWGIKAACIFGGFLGQGRHTVEYSPGILPPGVYLLQIRQGNNCRSKAVVME